MKRISLLIVLVVTFFASCKKTTAPVVVNTKDFSSLSAVVQSNLVQLGGGAGLVLMDKSGKILYKQYFGGFTDQTNILIASGSKWLSAATIMTLVDGGKLNLADKAVKFYPAAFAAADRNGMTLQQLLSHTSGFDDLNHTLLNLWINSQTISLQDAAKGIGAGGPVNGINQPAITTPYGPAGTKFAYGGVDMQVAGGMAELAGAKTWDVLFKQSIADKCNMLSTVYVNSGASGNYRIAGGVSTTMPDYANFLLMLLNDGVFNGTRVLSSASVAGILQDQTNNLPIAYTPYQGDGLRQGFHYGLGCWLEGANVWSSQGAFGFSPWVDKQNGIIGVLFVKAANLEEVNTTPNAANAPYTLIRNKVAAIFNN